MISIRRSEQRGHADHGWLKAKHTFSFASYFDPRFPQFGPLRVLNQDRIQAGQGFPTHGHQDMEIVTYVLDGQLGHKDSMGTGSLILPGEVQYMCAGTGVTHSEFNASKDSELHLLQMWIIPRNPGSKPHYDQKAFPETERRGKLRLVVSPDGREGSITIDQDARMYAGLLTEAEQTPFELLPGRMAWVHVARGSLSIDGESLQAGDGAALKDSALYQLDGIKDAELVIWELPAS
jgi:redox-sensitive bicupin YhaK (pirin superfamily)